MVRGGGDIVACAETGTGKTAAFVLPLVDRLLAAATAAHAAGATPESARTRVLVLTPTRELAVQIDDDVQGFGYHAGVSSMAVYGGAPMEPQSRALAAGIPFVVATPGRLMDHMRSGTNFDGLETLVLDEADRMLDMGFWPDVRRIVDALPAKRQTLLFSATMPNEILGFARAIMQDPALIQVGRRNQAARTISHAVEHVPDRREDRLAGQVPARRLGTDPRLRPHQARRRQALLGPRLARHPHRGAARRPDPEGSPLRGRGLQVGPHPRPRRHRHRGPRARHRRHHPRRQLRRAALARGLRPSRRPHRPRPGDRPRPHAGVARRGARAQGRPRLARPRPHRRGAVSRLGAPPPQRQPRAAQRPTGSAV